MTAVAEHSYCAECQVSPVILGHDRKLLSFMDLEFEYQLHSGFSLIVGVGDDASVVRFPQTRENQGRSGTIVRLG